MNRAQVVYQTRKAGGGTVWVHRPRGTWRAIQFGSGPTTCSKLLGLTRVLDRLGAATTTVLPAAVVLAPQSFPGPETDIPATMPRPGPAVQPACPQAP